MCVDYHNLNITSPKDDFSLSYIDVLVDNVFQNATYSFIDEFSSYIQNKMALKDKNKITFMMSQGTYCYKMMAFDLNNIGATYQYAIMALFHDLMHREIEIYINNMISK